MADPTLPLRTVKVLSHPRRDKARHDVGALLIEATAVVAPRMFRAHVQYIGKLEAEQHRQRDHALIHPFGDADEIVLVQDIVAQVRDDPVGRGLVVRRVRPLRRRQQCRDPSSGQIADVVPGRPKAVVLPVEKGDKVVVGGFGLFARDLEMEEHGGQSGGGVPHHGPQKGLVRHPSSE